MCGSIAVVSVNAKTWVPSLRSRSDPLRAHSQLTAVAKTRTFSSAPHVSVRATRLIERSVCDETSRATHRSSSMGWIVSMAISNTISKTMELNFNKCVMSQKIHKNLQWGRAWLVLRASVIGRWVNCLSAFAVIGDVIRPKSFAGLLVRRPRWL
jgi:hypothetical protein